MLKDFYALLPELYGNQSCTINAHLLIHISYFVRQWGPCWTHSALSFQSHNGALKRLIHSTRRVAEQLSFSLDVSIILQNLYWEIEKRECDSVISYLQSSRHSLRSMKKVSQGYAIGTIKSDGLIKWQWTSRGKKVIYHNNKGRYYIWATVYKWQIFSYYLL